MSPRRRSREWALVLFVAAFLAFNPPILSIFSLPDLVLGIPVLYIYIFTAWGCVIALLALNESGFISEPPEDPAPGLPVTLPGARADDAAAATDLAVPLQSTSAVAPGDAPGAPADSPGRPEER